MDTSETYIKMCEKAKEIQDYARSGMFLHPEKQYFASYTTDAVPLGSYDCFGKVWLPRQDQLQEMTDWDDAKYRFDGMVTVPKLNVIGKLGNVMEFATEGWRHKIHYPTMEQLWLAFVMKGKYGKVWDGEKWNSLA